MTEFARDRWGDTIDKPNDKELDGLLDSLAMGGGDREDVSLTHDSGWSLSVFDGGLVVFQNDEDGSAPVHMTDQSRQQILSLWHSLARGETEALHSHAWQDGAQPDD